jgi:hypothetical protein
MGGTAPSEVCEKEQKHFRDGAVPAITIPELVTIQAEAD